MTLFEEVQQLSSESHAKWFERYFREYDLVQKIKISARQGFKGFLISVLSVKDEYTQRRLDDERTLKSLKELLGTGFNVEYKFYYTRNILTGDKCVKDKKIHITW